jgi:hypothetical protein
MILSTTTVRHAVLASLVFGAAAPAFATSIDTSGMLYVEPATNVVTEGNGDGDVQDVVFKVNLGYADIARPQSVEYEIVPGTAMPGEDYQPIPPGTLVFEVGERTKDIVVHLIGDLQPECSEYFFLRLTRGGIEAAKVIATIRDDDTQALDGGVMPSCVPKDSSDGGSGDTPPDLTGVSTPDPLDSGATLPIATVPSSDPGTTSAPQRTDSSSGCSMARTSGSPWMTVALVQRRMAQPARSAARAADRAGCAIRLCLPWPSSFHPSCLAPRATRRRSTCGAS